MKHEAINQTLFDGSYDFSGKSSFLNFQAMFDAFGLCMFACSQLCVRTDGRSKKQGHFYGSGLSCWTLTLLRHF